MPLDNHNGTLCPLESGPRDCPPGPCKCRDACLGGDSVEGYVYRRQSIYQSSAPLPLSPGAVPNNIHIGHCLQAGTPIGYFAAQAATSASVFGFIGVAQTSTSTSIPLPPDAQPDPAASDTLGWRCWRWDTVQRCLRSPHQQDTYWFDETLTAPNWSDSDAVRGAAGIHARRMPKADWRKLGWPSGDGSDALNPVTGIVERFGKFVLGATGWRAECVVIREIAAPSTEIGLQLEQRYPTAIVHYPFDDREHPCRSEKLNALVSARCQASPQDLIVRDEWQTLQANLIAQNQQALLASQSRPAPGSMISYRSEDYVRPSRFEGALVIAAFAAAFAITGIMAMILFAG